VQGNTFEIVFGPHIAKDPELCNVYMCLDTLTI